MDGQPEHSSDRVQKVLTTCFCIIVLLPTGLYGAVDPILIEATTAVSLLFLGAVFVLMPPPHHLRSKIFLAAAATTFAVLYAVFQAARFPGNPFANPVWTLPVETAGGPLATSISMSPERTFAAIVPLASVGLSFVGSLWLARDDRQPLFFLKVFTVLSGTIAILSVTQFEVAPHWLIAIPKSAYLDSLTAPFVNRNTAATFYGLSALVAVMTCLRSMTQLSEAQAGARRVREAGSSKFGALILGLFGLAALTALLLTRSRGGLLSSLVAFAFYMPALAILSQNPRPVRQSFGESRPRLALRRIATVLLIAFAVIAAFVILGQRQLVRMDVEGVDRARLCILPQVISLARDNFSWGTGLGTFEQAFNAYRDPQCGIYGRWLSAHNVFLDIAVTAGLPGLILTVLTIGFLVYTLIVGTRSRRRQRGLPLGGLAAMLLVLSHGLIDFSLEIPGLAVPFAAILGACVAASQRPAVSTAMAEPGSATKDAAGPKPKDWWNDPGIDEAAQTSSAKGKTA